MITTTADISVAAAAKLMRHHHVGTVVIMETMNDGLGTPIGIVTDRDIVVEELATEELSELTKVPSREQAREYARRR